MTRPGIILLSLIIAIHLSLFLFTSLRPNRIAPQGHTYTKLGGNFFYPNIIRQAKDGANAIIDSHTTRPTPRVYGYVFFIAAGKIAHLFDIDPILMYQLTIITGGIALSIAIYVLITLTLPKSLHLTALLFTLVLETGPKIVDITTKSIDLWSATIEGQSSVSRLFGLPHHTWGEALGVLLLSLLVVSTKKMKPLYILGIIVLAFIGTNTLPSYFVIMVACIFVPWIFSSLVDGDWKKVIPPLFLATLAILVGGEFVHTEFAKGPPWNMAVSIEKSWWTNEFVLVPYVQSLILYYPFMMLAILGIPSLWKSMQPQFKRTYIIALGWSTLPILLIFMSTAPWFPIANGRIASDISYVPIGLLATFGVWAMGVFIQNIKLRMAMRTITLGLLFGLSIILSIAYTQRTIEAQDARISSYPTIDTWRAVLALQTVPQGSGVLVLPTYGEIIPGFANVRVFIGGPHGFLDWIERRGLTQQFYVGTMEKHEVQQFLSANDISYVFYGPEEKSLTITPPLYPDMLIPIFQTIDATVYKVK